MMTALLTNGHYPAIATHDPAMIELARSVARERQIASDRFEFQMLYGIRRDLQATLVKEGHRVRIYVPFGREWFPYFMRRLGERPANVMFVVRAILGAALTDFLNAQTHPSAGRLSALLPPTRCGAPAFRQLEQLLFICC
jgi:proline dehydrogenase